MVFCHHYCLASPGSSVVGARSWTILQYSHQRTCSLDLRHHWMHGQAIKRLIQDQARFAPRSRSWLKDGAKGSIGFGGKLWILTTSDKSFKREFSYCNLWCTLVCTSTFLTIGIWQCFDSEKNPALNLRVDMNLWNMPGCLRIWKPWISWCSPLKITIPPFETMQQFQGLSLVSWAASRVSATIFQCQVQKSWTLSLLSNAKLQIY